ncbi:MAG TPA: hypothetical protein VFB62_03615, partial [Polyangiaceae bacterium]|nr:hypothetical protein [Polyangiaceae bacterium]
MAALATLVSLAGVAGAQEETAPPPPPDEPAEGEKVEEQKPEGQKVEPEDPCTELERRLHSKTPPPPPVMAEVPPASPPPAVETTPPPAPIREALIVYDGDDEGRPEIASRIGIGLTAGGGVNDFTDDDVQAATQIGGAWDVRLTFGTRFVIAGELGYVGTARDITA